MPKRKIVNPKKHIFAYDQPLAYIINEEGNLYKKQIYAQNNLNKLEGREMRRETSNLLFNRILLGELSAKIDTFQQTVGEKVKEDPKLDVSELPEYKEITDLEDAINYGTAPFDYFQKKSLCEDIVDRLYNGSEDIMGKKLYDGLGEEKPLPIGIAGLINSGKITRENMDEKIPEVIKHVKEGTLDNYLAEQGIEQPDFDERIKAPEPQPNQELNQSKRRVRDIYELPFEINENKTELMNVEHEAYKSIQNQFANLPKGNENMGPERNRDNAFLFVKMQLLDSYSAKVDEALDRYRAQEQAQGDTEAENVDTAVLMTELNRIGRSSRNGLFLAEYNKEEAYQKATQQIDRIYDAIRDTAADSPYTDDLYCDPLPAHFAHLALADPELTDDQLKIAANLERKGELVSYLEQNGYYTNERLLPAGPRNEKKPLTDLFGKDLADEMKQEAEEERINNLEEEQKNKVEERLKDIPAARASIKDAIRDFYQAVLDSVTDPFGLAERLIADGRKLAEHFMVDGKPLEEAFPEQAKIENADERDKALMDALKNEYQNGTKQISFKEPHILDNGDMVQSADVVIKEDRDKLQLMQDSAQRYRMVVDRQLRELNFLKEEFGKTQDIPKANFDGNPANVEGSEYYQNMTRDLGRCLVALEEIQNGKDHTEEELRTLYDNFRKSCETYVENRQGRLFGPVTENGRERLELSKIGIENVFRMSRELGKYSDLVNSDMIIDADGKKFNDLDYKGREEYLKGLESKGIVKSRPEAEVEHEVALAELKTMNTFDIALRDYPKDKKGKYMESARDVILKMHNNVVVHGEKATNFDVIRMRYFDKYQKDLAENPVFRTMVDKKGVDATAKEWRDIEAKSEALRNSIKDDYTNRLTKDVQKEVVENGENKTVTERQQMTISEYVSGLGPVDGRPEIDKTKTPEEKIRQLEAIKDADPTALDEAYNRMTDVITDKLLLDNDKFGKEFINAKVAGQTEGMTLQGVDVRDQLKMVTKQLLVGNHVLEGKKLPKALKQLESGKLGEDLVNSVKEVYKNESKKMNKGSKELNIKAESLDVEQQMKAQGLTRKAPVKKAPEKAVEKQAAVPESSTASRLEQLPEKEQVKQYIYMGRASRDSLEDQPAGYTNKEGKVDQEKIQKIINGVAGKYIEDDIQKAKENNTESQFNTLDAIKKFEKSFFLKPEVLYGIIAMAGQKTGTELRNLIEGNKFSNELSKVMDEAKKPIDPNDTAKVQEKENVTKAAGEVKLPEHLKGATKKIVKEELQAGPEMK